MLDIKFIRENRQRVNQTIKNKAVDLDLEKLLSLDDKRRQLIQDLDKLNYEKKNHASLIKKSGKPEVKLIEQGKKIKDKIAKLEAARRATANEYRELMLLVPNVHSNDTPIGKNESENKEVRKWGETPEFTFPVKDHIALGLDLDLIDFERGVKVAGFRGYFLKNDLAMLQWALFSFCLQKMLDKGFQVMITPTIVSELGLTGTGWFPAGQAEIYSVDGKFLSGTAEVALMAYRAGEIIKASELPIKYCGVSPCYRREAGSYGKDTKGLYRVHEFWKVEQIILANNNLKESLKHFEDMLAISEAVLQDLQLPYRVVQICTGDMGDGKYKMYDLETWMPSRHAYSETHSCSLLTDWQTRRLNIRYRDDQGVTVFPHSMNNTVIASPRILIAILENFQLKDGTVDIPKVLQPLMGGKKVISKKMS